MKNILIEIIFRQIILFLVFSWFLMLYVYIIYTVFCIFLSEFYRFSELLHSWWLNSTIWFIRIWVNNDGLGLSEFFSSIKISPSTSKCKKSFLRVKPTQILKTIVFLNRSNKNLKDKGSKTKARSETKPDNPEITGVTFVRNEEIRVGFGMEFFKILNFPNYVG